MAKIKLPGNLKDVDVNSSSFEDPKPGMYICTIDEINDWSGQHGDGMEVVFKVKSTSKGETKDIVGISSRLWRRIYIDYEPTAFMLAELIDATGQKRTGTLDTTKMVGKEVQVRVKSGKNLDGDYRAEVGKILALAEGGGDEPEPDEPEAEPEDEGEAIDLDQLDRDELKKLIKDQELGTLAELGITKATTDDQIREIIAEKLGGEEEPEAEPEEEEEPEAEPEEEPEPEEDDLAGLDRDELKKLIKSESLGSLADLGINKATSDDEIRDKIREARGGEPEAEPDGDAAPDYSKWEPEQLKAELKERGIELEGRFSKAKSVKALKDDDGDDGDPF